MKARIKILGISILSLALTTCSGSRQNAGISDSPTGGSSGGTVSGGDGTGGMESVSPVGRAPRAGGNFLQAFPAEQIVSGGVPKDGIPALTDPGFVDLNSAEASYLSDDDLVIGVVINGEARAYPHNMGWWHEIVNDVVGGQPIVVSFCPLTGTGLVFDGQGSDGRITCGVSGLLFNNNLIMYDRRDDATLYPQMIHASIQGAGGELTLLPVIETTWRYWKQLYPHSQVVSIESGTYSASTYNRYPYGSYRSPTVPPQFQSFPPLTDNATAQILPPKAVTLGVRFEEMAKAYPFDVMGDEAVINDTLAGSPLLVVFYAREHYAIPFSRRVNGQTLTFEKTASTDPVFPFMLKDSETGSTWDLRGQAVSGQLQGQTLQQVPAHNAFWFAWATFWQNTGIY